MHRFASNSLLAEMLKRLEEEEKEIVDDGHRGHYPIFPERKLNSGKPITEGNAIYIIDLKQ